MSEKAVLLEKEESVAIITLNRPDALNAINMQLREELIEVLKEVSEDKEVRAVLITGAGRAFCAGERRKTSGDERDNSKSTNRAWHSSNINFKHGETCNSGGKWCSSRRWLQSGISM
jgi:enoyl-CoA hydratase/carnithine racemase